MSAVLTREQDYMMQAALELYLNEVLHKLPAGKEKTLLLQRWKECWDFLTKEVSRE